MLRMRSARAFTLVETLVVVAVIAILIGILLPGLRMARAASQAATSQANLRQWGVGLGAWTLGNDETLPWEGSKVAADMGSNLAVREFWPNALASMLGIETYAEMSERAFRAQADIDVWENRSNVWSDPAAQPDMEAPYSFGETGPGGIPRQFFFCYAMNYRMNRTLRLQAGLPEASRDALLKTGQIGLPDRTVMMLELRASPSEVPAADPHRAASLDRAVASWKRFAARHSGGGHMTFLDGHVAWYSNEEATTNVQGSRDPATANGDWNNGKLVWDPLGPALN